MSVQRSILNQLMHYVIVTGDNLSFDKNGKSEISYADYARALVDEIKNDKHENQRISVRW